MNEIDGCLLFGEVNHSNFTRATAQLAGDLAVEGLRASEDPWIASMDVVARPVALRDGGFGVSLHTTTAYDAEMLREMAETSLCRGLSVQCAEQPALDPSVESVVARLRSGTMARSAK